MAVEIFGSVIVLLLVNVYVVFSRPRLCLKQLLNHETQLYGIIDLSYQCAARYSFLAETVPQIGLMSYKFESFESFAGIVDEALWRSP